MATNRDPADRRDLDRRPDRTLPAQHHRPPPLAAYHLIALRGLRRGEAAGLRWCDLDLDNRIAVINSQSQRIGGVIVQGPPKTEASRRTIALDHTTVPPSTDTATNRQPNSPHATPTAAATSSPTSPDNRSAPNDYRDVML